MTASTFSVGTIVLPRSDPDLDGVACAVAHAELLSLQGFTAKPWYSGEPDGEARYLMMRYPEIGYADSIEIRGAAAFVLVDASGLEGFPSELDPMRVTEVIDHRFHGNAERAFPRAQLCLEHVGAAATIIAERFVKHNLMPSPTSACMLFGAIHSNTQCLRGSVTTARDQAASGWLLSASCIPPDLVANQFQARTAEILADLPAALRRECKQYKHPTGDYAISQLEFAGAGEVLKMTEATLRTELAGLKLRTILNLVDVESARSFLLVPDIDLQSLLNSARGLVFERDVSEAPRALLRKQIVDSLNPASRR